MPSRRRDVRVDREAEPRRSASEAEWLVSPARQRAVGPQDRRRLAVTAGSFCRTEPAAVFRALA